LLYQIEHEPFVRFVVCTVAKVYKPYDNPIELDEIDPLLAVATLPFASTVIFAFV
jgi:hypothetical protein